MVPLAFTAACSRPAGYCRFMKKGDASQQIYEFNVSVPDSATAYDTYAMCRYDAHQYPMTTAVFVVRYVADNGFEMVEQHVIKAVDAMDAKRNGSIVDLKFRLGEGIKFSRSGEWKVMLEIPNKEFCRAAAGFGFSMEEKE